VPRAGCSLSTGSSAYLRTELTVARVEAGFSRTCSDPGCGVPGARASAGRTGKGNPCLKAVLGEAAAARTDTFLGERYRRIARRRGNLRALVAIARTILVIIWHLLTSRTARFRDLGASYYANRTDTTRKARSHVRHLGGPRFTVTRVPAA
jgi:transposase